MKRFLITLMTIFIFACSVCFYFTQTYETFDYTSIENMRNFPVSGNLDQYFFMKPSEIQTMYPTDSPNYHENFLTTDEAGNEIGIITPTILTPENIDNITADLSEAEELKNKFEEADLIVVATIYENYKILYQEMQQPIYVEQVIRGDKTLEGTTIYYHEDSERFRLNSNQQIIGGFVMPMQVGEKYLLFMNEINDIVSNKNKIYFGVQPFGYLCLNDMENQVITENNTYDNIFNYEFIAVDEKGLQLALEFKKEILNTYLPEE